MINKLSVLQLCNRHLIDLFHAIENEDVKSILRIEHELTPEEECVACVYSLRAPKKIRDILDDFSKQQDFFVSGRKNQTGASFAKYLIIRLLLFSLLLFIIWQWGLITKKFLTGVTFMNSLGFFGWVGVFILALAIFSLFEFSVLED